MSNRGTEIPKPPGWPIIGNALEVSNQGYVKRLAAQYGSIFKVSLGTGTPDRIIISSVELLNEICDEKRFAKNPTAGGLAQVRNLTGDGLFTALDGEENWGLAHRTLMPVLGPVAIGDMFDDMHEIASQMVLKWARQEEGAKITATEDFTRLTLDTLALCTMDTRFNSFYSETSHAFVTAMNSFLLESGNRAVRPSLVTDYIYTKRTQQYAKDMELMQDIAKRVIARRRAAPIRKRDLVDAMIHECDPKTGKHLPEDNIIKNMITFLIAGHETTSGLLSFLLYCLVTHPDIVKKAREEVSAVVGKGPLSSSMTSKLPYVTAVIRETLRLYPTAPAFTVQLRNDLAENPVLIGKEQYKIRKGESLIASLSLIHRDRAVYGDDAETFRPERMLDEHFNKLPRNSWKPFGNGARGCIGRAFAMQESTIVAALLLQNFDFELFDPNYTLEVKKTLTVKPKDFNVRARLRDGLTPGTLQRRLLGGLSSTRRTNLIEERTSMTIKNIQRYDLKDLLICYGSNAGTCQTLAHVLSRNSSSHGFRAQVLPMDNAMELVSTEIPIVIITASYEGEPPDNAVKFVKWIGHLTESPFAGCHHAVFGCGNRDWADTFQKIPSIVDDTFKRCGSSPLVVRGVSDATDNNIFNEFDRWADQSLWPALAKVYHIEVREDTVSEIALDIIQNTRATVLLQGGGQAMVQEARVLTAPSEPQKNHLKVRLPLGMAYESGDRLAILPVNLDARVKDVMTRFGLAVDARVANSEKCEQSVYTYLREYVELSQIATEKNVHAIVQSMPEGSDQKELMTMSPNTIITQKMSVLDILQKFPSAALPFTDYIAMLPPLHARQYSISSSPLAGADTCTLTFTVLGTKSVGNPCAVYLGAGSNYLASLRPNDRLWVSVRPAPRAFHLPEDPSTPIVMICAGSGLAPFMGFIQERMKMMEQGVLVGPAMLFVGCRHPERDLLYESDLQTWVKKDVIDVKYAFSRAPERSDGCRYVQDRLWKDRDLVIPLFKRAGKLFVCGDTKVLDGVGKAVVKTYAARKGVSMEEAQAWFKASTLTVERHFEIFD
ncbi:fatty acid hydroxylase [Lophiostoma macrostomum CBS 122681]|uniref:Bifunctional cytochrome P450/NADPH--P450 reductase n=1 Tax=Lophiostoma macrostomum CBS 122681 TaxID=1314788 RepID=A0A6A6SVF5_9PLEO|nr:fatty acid hydroxylase [Lophiostoma macrostomum CBS 122681]